LPAASISDYGQRGFTGRPGSKSKADQKQIKSRSKADQKQIKSRISSGTESL
jgi:hypothetical protein